MSDLPDLALLKAEFLDVLAQCDGTINAACVRMALGRPPDCRETLAVLDRLIALGLVRVVAGDRPAGDIRRLEADVAITPAGVELLRRLLETPA